MAQFEFDGQDFVDWLMNKEPHVKIHAFQLLGQCSSSALEVFDFRG